jgi:hypothetical protein
MEASDLMSQLRSMVQHEAEQLHRRLSWLGTFQGFLFAALGFSWGKSNSLKLIICLLGITVAMLILVGIFTAMLAMRRLRALWLSKKPGDYDGPDIFGYFPEAAPWTVFTSPEILLPLAFSAAWIAIMIYA